MRYYYHWSVFWANPYTEPPAGMPRFLIDKVTAPRDRRWSSRNVPGCIHLITDQMTREGLHTYSIGCTAIDIKPPRKQSLAGKQSRRRKLLMGRLMKKYPLFAEPMYQEAIANKPEYYGR